MRENVLDVLMYLFENYVYTEEESAPDRDSLQVQLLEAGFPMSQVEKALDWLDGLAESREEPELATDSDRPLRLFSRDEIRRLDTESRGFLMYLEHAGVLDAASRELILDRVMALEAEAVDLDDLKWLILMVLFNQPGQEAACAWMENLLLEPGIDLAH